MIINGIKLYFGYILGHFFILLIIIGVVVLLSIIAIIYDFIKHIGKKDCRRCIHHYYCQPRNSIWCKLNSKIEIKDGEDTYTKCNQFERSKK